MLSERSLEGSEACAESFIIKQSLEVDALSKRRRAKREIIVPLRATRPDPSLGKERLLRMTFKGNETQGTRGMTG